MESKKDKDDGYNPRIGVPILLSHMLFYCTSRSFAKFLMERNPEMTTFQFMYIKALTGLLINVVMINTDLKKVMYDTIDKENKNTLIAKMIVAVVATFLAYTGVYYFPLTYSTALKNVAPFFTILFACLFLTERPTCR